jgi:hypothetical protein
MHETLAVHNSVIHKLAEKMIRETTIGTHQKLIVRPTLYRQVAEQKHGMLPNGKVTW